MICIWSKTAAPPHTFVIILSFDIIMFLTLFTIIPDSIGPFGRGHLAVFHAVQSILQAEAVGTGMESMFLDAASAVHDVGSAVRNTGSTVYNAALIIESIFQIVGAALRSVFSGSFSRSRLPATSTGTSLPQAINQQANLNKRLLAQATYTLSIWDERSLGGAIKTVFFCSRIVRCGSLC